MIVYRRTTSKQWGPAVSVAKAKRRNTTCATPTFRAGHVSLATSENAITLFERGFTVCVDDEAGDIGHALPSVLPVYFMMTSLPTPMSWCPKNHRMPTTKVDICFLVSGAGSASPEGAAAAASAEHATEPRRALLLLMLLLLWWRRTAAVEEEPAATAAAAEEEAVEALMLRAPAAPLEWATGAGPRRAVRPWTARAPAAVASCEESMTDMAIRVPTTCQGARCCCGC